MRRRRAVTALAEALGMSHEKAADVLESVGLKALTERLHGLGFVYDTAARRWLVPVNESVFVRQN
jgi:hypothetical protein